MKLSNRIRRWNQAIHRDLGYLFAGMTVIYAISGIALNHLKEWDPNYIIEAKDIRVDAPIVKAETNKSTVLALLAGIDEEENYKKHYFPEEGILKVFLDGGSVTIDMATGEGLHESIRRRPVFFEVNFLHYNTPRKLFTWYSDIFAGSLALLAIGGLFILKGKNGITGRGAWLTAIGLIIPAIFLIIYL